MFWHVFLALNLPSLEFVTQPFDWLTIKLLMHLLYYLLPQKLVKESEPLTAS